MRILGDAVQVIGGGGETCHLWWYGRHLRLKATVKPTKPDTQSAVVMRKTHFCQYS